MSIARISKTVASIVIAVYVWAGEVVLSAPKAITAAEWYALSGAVLVAAGVYAVANKPAPDKSVPTPDVVVTDDVLPAVPQPFVP